MPYRDPEKQRQAKRDSERRRRQQNTEQIRAADRERKEQQRRAQPDHTSRSAPSQAVGLGQDVEKYEPFGPEDDYDPGERWEQGKDSWRPIRGWRGFYQRFDLRREIELWETYLSNWRPASQSLARMHELPVADHVSPYGLGSMIEGEIRQRAEVLANTLASEPRFVQRIARWRRHFPTADWSELERWLSREQIEQTVSRLRAYGFLTRHGQYRPAEDRPVEDYLLIR